MNNGQVAEFLTKVVGLPCRVSKDTDHFDLFIDSMPDFEMAFGLVKDFRSLAAITPMISQGIREYQAEHEAYMKIKTQKRGPYRKRTTNLPRT